MTNRSPSSSSSDFVLVDAVEESLTTTLPRRQFIEDLIHKSFPLPPRLSSSHSEVVEEDEPTLCLDSELDGIGDSPRCKEPTPASSSSMFLESPVSHLVSDEVWPQIWKQFQLDVGRQIFTVDSLELREADEAFQRIRQLMLATLVQRIQEEEQERKEDLPDHGRGVNIAPSTASYGGGWMRYIFSHILSFGANTPARRPTLDPYGEEVRAAADRMTRLVVLLSQQSVMGLPYEELHRKYLQNEDEMLCLESSGGAMSVTLSTTPVEALNSPLKLNSGEKPRSLGNPKKLQPTLRVHKKFRIFSLEDTVKTKCFVDTELIIDLFAMEHEPVLMIWNVAYPSPTSARQQTEGDPTTSPSMTYVPERLRTLDHLTDEQATCQCVGGSFGFHQPGVCDIQRNVSEHRKH